METRMIPFEQRLRTDSSQNIIIANAKTLRNWLDQAFPGRWIERHESIEWPARSPDLITPDIFLWHYVKDKIYSLNINTLQDLKEVNTEKFTAVPHELCTKSYENVPLRLQACIDPNDIEVDNTMENLKGYLC
ncbi:hypothetical protein AVEN_215245-1 [Araneus ventricosus]|uniref:Tc1-like transposase DDE domain-containing protein n=1 Tax=Araneus ventricosus TaxID=182803 RepID=A0A4Y2M8A0_ARAVE|nr:hypothetical protein AVEN_215245-1 [Araneus ventricosus]